MKRKIVHIITRLDKGGSAENVVITCRGTDPARYESELWYGSSATAEMPAGFRSVLIPELKRNIAPLDDIKAFFKLVSLLRRAAPDIVHTHSSKAGFLGRWAAKCAGIRRIVHTPHGHVYYGYEFGKLKTALYLFLDRMSAPITDVLIALGDGEMQESIAFGVGKPGQWTVAHSGMNLDQPETSRADALRKEWGIPPDALIIGTVARLEHVKGIPVFVDAMPRILKMVPPAIEGKVRFLVVGDGEQRASLERAAAAAGIREKVHFTGMRVDVPDIMSLIDIYVQPSLNEGLGKTLIQAQAAGCPVVASNVQGIPDAMKDGMTGILVPPGRPEDLANGVARLCREPGLRRSYGENGRRWVREPVNGLPRFSSERMTELLRAVYDGCVHD